MKNIFLLVALAGTALIGRAQVIYSNSFNNLGLQTYTTASASTQFTTLPAGFDIINDTLTNDIGSPTNPNRPFNVPALNKTGWAVVYNQADNDTFMVSTSWVDTTGIAVDRWAITPLISNITANTVLTWLAKSPDATFPEGYEVYGTTYTGALTPAVFTVGDRLFALVDGNTLGAGELSSWTRRSVNIGTFAGQNLRFAFHNNSKDMYQLWIDDIQVLNISNNYDMALSSDFAKRYQLTNSADSVQVNITNLGAATVTNVVASYQIGNSSVNTETIAFASGLGYLQSGLLRFALPYNISLPGYYTVKCWISYLDGQADQVITNDTTRYDVTIQATSPPKTILFEQFISANNGEGPDAQEKLIALQSPSVIAVNIHDLDSIKALNAGALITDYKKDFATALIDRFYFSGTTGNSVERPYYDALIGQRVTAVTPASVSIVNKTYNAATRQLSFDLRADFAGEVKGDYRLNAYLTENYVAGLSTDTTINGYNQLNNAYNIPWSTYYETGYFSTIANTYVLRYWEYRHHNALVYAFDGAYGSSGVIPSTGGTQNQFYQQTFSVTIPMPASGISKFNPDNLYIVGFAAEYSADKTRRNVLNAVKEKVTGNAENVGIQEFAGRSSALLVYPNPSTGVFYFNAASISGDYTLSVFDVLGKCMQTINGANSSHSIETLDLSALPGGIYFMKVDAGQQHFTQKLMIQKGRN